MTFMQMMTLSKHLTTTVFYLHIYSRRLYSGCQVSQNAACTVLLTVYAKYRVSRTSSIIGFIFTYHNLSEQRKMNQSNYIASKSLLKIIYRKDSVNNCIYILSLDHFVQLLGFWTYGTPGIIKHLLMHFYVCLFAK